MQSSSILFFAFLLITSLVLVNFLFSAFRKKKYFEKRKLNNLQGIWEKSYSEFEYKEFVSVWSSLANLVEVHPELVNEKDNIKTILSLSSQEELVQDELEHFLGQKVIEDLNVSINSTFGELVRKKLISNI